VNAFQVQLFPARHESIVSQQKQQQQKHPTYFNKNNNNVRERRIIFSMTSSSSSSYERYSPQVRAALTSARNEASRLNKENVSPEFMMLGITEYPENAHKTLFLYGITYARIKNSVGNRGGAAANVNQYFGDTMSLSCDHENSFAGMFYTSQPQIRKDLPLSLELVKCLSNAEKIADELESAEIKSEHVLLALLEYESDPKTGKIKAAQAGVSEDGERYISGALQVIYSLQGKAESFNPKKFCYDLLNTLNPQHFQQVEQEKLMQAGAAYEEFEVGPSDLDEFGTDLTMKAKMNQLDPVFGREEEILMAIRTLVRRRKNNPCLIGEPGVGKTAVVEGIAQILAAPSMLAQAEKEKAALEADDEADDVDSAALDKKIKDLQKKAKLCPPHLSHHRVFSLELASLVAGTKYRGEFEQRLQSLVSQLTDDTDTSSLE
jgi:ATP-dependent Clp protease ATP-binding subunit ClpC